MGDGTTSVVLLAGEILKSCKTFVEDNVHPQARWRGEGEKNGDERVEREKKREFNLFLYSLQILVRGLRKVAHLSITRIKEIAVHVRREDEK